MSTCALLSLAILSVVGTAFGRGPLRAQFPSHDIHTKYVKDQFGTVDPGEPLFITPYIEKGDFETAKKLSLVGNIGAKVQSYAGFLTVNKTYNSNMFFWYFPSQGNPSKDPVMLWLQGGPGGSSLFGLFVENGPIGVDKKLKIFPRPVTWNSKYSMIYIDNPVGTGFSFTQSDKGYATNEDDVAVNLYTALVQFFAVFSELKNVDFYITGESYAGKYIPAIAHYIHKEPHPKKIHLRGVAIGDGFSDPPVMVGAYADFLFQIGVLDENQRDHFQSQTDQVQKLIQNKKFADAFKLLNTAYGDFNDASGIHDMYNYLRTELWDLLLNGDVSSVPSFFTNCTGSTDYYNFMRTKAPAEYEYYNDFLAMSNVRKAIHVGNLTYNSGAKVEQFLMNDVLDTVKPWLAEIMNYYKVLIYSGQLDIIVALPLTEAMLQTVPWQYLDEYKKADRIVWKVHPEDTEVAGYVRRVHDFYQVAVRGGGHILPHDQPERSFDMIDRFITGRPFN